jgi:hypothetical protein
MDNNLSVHFSWILLNNDIQYREAEEAEMSMTDCGSEYRTAFLAYSTKTQLAVTQASAQVAFIGPFMIIRYTSTCRSVFRSLLSGQHRSYALSRFPERNPGVSRKSRRSAAPRSSSWTEPLQHSQHEDRPSAVQSGLWEEASQRTPAGDPKKGLDRLLLQNETLVITRWESPYCIFVLLRF